MLKIKLALIYLNYNTNYITVFSSIKICFLFIRYILPDFNVRFKCVEIWQQKFAKPFLKTTFFQGFLNSVVF